MNSLLVSGTSNRPRSKAVVNNAQGLFSSVGEGFAQSSMLVGGDLLDDLSPAATTTRIGMVASVDFTGIIGHPVEVLTIVCSFFRHQAQYVINGKWSDDVVNLSVCVRVCICRTRRL